MRTLILFFVTLTAHAGSFTGNGADRKGPGHGAAWFLGDRAVRWCGNNSAIQPALESAARKWADYIAAKKVPEALNAPLPFALRFEKLPTCDGVDLVVDVSEDKDATVFSGSELLAQDLAHGWGKGRIWLSPALLQSPRALETQLLHQLGHVLGNDHVGGTVMAENIADLAPVPSFQPEIDGARELYLCLGCTASWRGTNGQVYREANGVTAITSGDKNSILHVTATLAASNHGDAKVFSAVLGGWQGHLASRSFSRLALLAGPDGSSQVIVNRNFDKLVEVSRLVNGRPELLFEAIGE